MRPTYFFKYTSIIDPVYFFRIKVCADIANLVSSVVRKGTFVLILFEAII